MIYGNRTEFFCCRLKTALQEAKLWKDFDFLQYLEETRLKSNEIFIQSNIEISEIKDLWHSRYGPCFEITVTDNSEVVVGPSSRWTFLLNTFDYDTIGDSNLFVTLVFKDGNEANEIVPWQGHETVATITGIIEIIDYDCHIDYPGICSDVTKPYRDSVRLYVE